MFLNIVLCLVKSVTLCYNIKRKTKVQLKISVNSKRELFLYTTRQGTKRNLIHKLVPVRELPISIVIWIQRSK